MDTIEVKRAIDELGTAFAAFKQSVEAERVEQAKKGYVTAEALEKSERINAALDAAEKAKANAERVTTRLDEIETALKRPGASGGDDAVKQLAREHKAALDRYLRKGDGEADLLSLQTKTLATATLPDGGYLLTPDREAGVIARALELGGLRSVAYVRSTTSDVVEVPRAKTAATAASKVSEQGTRNATTTPQFAIASIPVGEYYSMPAATQRMLDDAGLDVEAFIADHVANEFALAENTAFVSGNGVGGPRGILTYSNGTTDGTIEQVVSGHATTLTAGGLIDLQSSLFESFQPNARFAFRRTTLGAIRKMTEAVNGQFLWQPGLAAGVPPTLLGKEYVIVPDMPAVGAAALAVAYGDFRAGYMIVDRQGVRVLRDPFSSKPLVLFYTTKRVGGDVINFQAIKLQVVSA